MKILEERLGLKLGDTFWFKHYSVCIEEYEFGFLRIHYTTMEIDGKCTNTLVFINAQLEPVLMVPVSLIIKILENPYRVEILGGLEGLNYIHKAVFDWYKYWMKKSGKCIYKILIYEQERFKFKFAKEDFGAETVVEFNLFDLTFRETGIVMNSQMENNFVIRPYIEELEAMKQGRSKY